MPGAGYHNRYGLVRCGQEHRDKRAQCNHFTAVEVGCHGRKTALGKTTQDSAVQKTGLPAAGQKFFYTPAVPVLHKLNQPVCRKQKRQHFYAVAPGVRQDVE